MLLWRMALMEPKKVFIVLCHYDYEGYDAPIAIATTRKCAREAASAYRGKTRYIRWRAMKGVEDVWCGSSTRLEIQEHDLLWPSTKKPRKPKKRAAPAPSRSGARR